jgi:hypothetical protein
MVDGRSRHSRWRAHERSIVESVVLLDCAVEEGAESVHGEEREALVSLVVCVETG